MGDNKSGDTGAGYENDTSENNFDEDEKNEKKETPVLEWITAGIGLILVVGAIGFVLFNALSRDNSPPVLIVTREKTKQIKTGYLIEFKVKNAGSQTASAVVVEGSLVQNGENIETGEVTLDYVPSNSEREGGLIFSANPEKAELKLHAKGYEKP